MAPVRFGGVTPAAGAAATGTGAQNGVGADGAVDDFAAAGDGMLTPEEFEMAVRIARGIAAVPLAASKIALDIAMSQTPLADDVVATSGLAFGATARLGARRGQKFVLAPGNRYAGGRDGDRLVLQSDVYFSGSEPMLDSALARLSSADSVVMQGALMVTDNRVYGDKRVRPFIRRLDDMGDIDGIYRSLRSLGNVHQAPIFPVFTTDTAIAGLSVFHLHLEDLSGARFPPTQYTFYRGGMKPVVVEGLSTLYLKAGDTAADRVSWQRWYGAIPQIKANIKHLFDAMKTNNRGRGGDVIITALERIMLDTEASYRKYLASPTQDVLISQDDMTAIANFFSKVWDYIETARDVTKGNVAPIRLDDKYRELTRVFAGPVFKEGGVR